MPLQGPRNHPSSRRLRGPSADGPYGLRGENEGEAAQAAGLKPRPSGRRVKTHERGEKSGLDGVQCDSDRRGLLALTPFTMQAPGKAAYICRFSFLPRVS
jgi:hypothetical protein